MPDSAPAVLYLDLGGLDPASGEALLRDHGLEVLHVRDRPSVAQLARVVALLVGYDDVGEDWFGRLPGLQLVATHSAGVDMVDLEAARRRGIWVTNLAGGASEEVAVHALAMVLTLVRRLPAFDRDVREGRWDSGAAEVPRLPSDLTCAVIGMGRIGRRFVDLARPLFGRVVGYDPHLPVELWPDGVDRMELADALSVGDCVSLHLPLTQDTASIVDAEALASMPAGSVLVNVSRGRLVDEGALLASLGSGHLAAAACDVLAQEPPASTDAILRERRVLLSPHVAYLSPGSLRRYVEEPARNVLALLDRGAPLSPVLTPGPDAARNAP